MFKRKFLIFLLLLLGLTIFTSYVNAGIPIIKIGVPNITNILSSNFSDYSGFSYETSDIYVNESGDTMTGDLNIDGDIIANYFFGSGQHLSDLSIDEGLVGNWNFATGARDYSGYGNDGTVSGATHKGTGGFNGAGAYEFDGVNDYITVPYDSSLDICAGTNCSMFAWIKINGDPATLREIVSNQVSNLNGFRIRVDSTRTVTFYGANATALSTALTSTAKVLPDTWTFVGFTYNTGGNIVIYVNGVSKSGTSGSITNNGDSLYIGMRQLTSSLFNGTIDSVAIYNRSLSADEIKRLYQSRPSEQSTIFDEKVGIGTTTPQQEFNVIGDANITEELIVGGNITLKNGGKVWDNASCTFISSPDGSTVTEICNA